MKLVLLTVTLLSSVLGNRKCRALVMSGGANNGAWEGGVMWGLAHYGNPRDFHWDVVTGISAGSINTAYLVGWSPGHVV
jgi:predicted acylesterase/phospholipase RssA